MIAVGLKLMTVEAVVLLLPMTLPTGVPATVVRAAVVIWLVPDRSSVPVVAAAPMVMAETVAGTELVPVELKVRRPLATAIAPVKLFVPARSNIPGPTLVMELPCVMDPKKVSVTPTVPKAPMLKTAVPVDVPVAPMTAVALPVKFPNWTVNPLAEA